MNKPAKEAQTLPKPGILSGIKALGQRLRGGELSVRRLTLSVALGLFIGCTPLYGFHLLLTTGLCLLLRLDTLVAYLAANISVPPMVPLILFVEFQVGTYLLTGTWHSLSLSEVRAERAGELGIALVSGVFVVATLVALLGAGATFFVARAVMTRKAQVG